jgi:putative transposase
MPRTARLDAPGTLHHVIIRGIEKREIFYTDKDREDFIRRVADLTDKTGNNIMAWALMPNHVHVLLKSGGDGLSTFMRRLLTGYAVSFNLRHQRSGYLFQNRYKSIVCEEDAYFKELVRYIHLNPIRAGIVETLDGLSSYPWTGHAVLVGNIEQPWMASEDVLTWFGNTRELAIGGYLRYMLQGLDQGSRPELVGGGLIRSIGGWGAVKSMRNTGDRELSDARILGDGAFVAQILDDIEGERKRQFTTNKNIDSSIEFIKSACHHHQVSYKALLNGGRSKGVAGLRRKLAASLFNEFGLTKAEIARQLGVTTAGIVKILRRTGG